MRRAPSLWALAILAGCRSSDPISAPAPRPPAPYFADGSQASGLGFVHRNGMSGALYILEMMGAGVALFDYDNDGDLDLYLRQGAALGSGMGRGPARAGAPTVAPTDCLLRNDLVVRGGARTVRWTEVTAESGIGGASYGMGVASGDIDNDGWTDLYLTNFGPNRLLRNRGDGSFEDVTARAGADDGRWSTAATFFDYDRDGWLDLFIGNYIDFSLANHHVCYRASSAPDYCGPLSYRPQPDRLLHNRGDGTFEDVTAGAGLAGAYGNALGAVALDADQDGWIDLYVANDAMENQLWINRGDGTFTDQALLRGVAVNGDGEREGSMGVAVGDFDRDGDDDLFLTHMATETNTLYVNDGQGMFHDGTLLAGLVTPSRAFTGFGTAFIDVENDGLLDLMTVNGAVRILEPQERAGDPLPLRQRKQLFRNLGSGRFAEIRTQAGAAFAVEEVGRGAAFGDVDNDGDTDVVVANNNGAARLLLSQIGQEQPWIGLRVVAGVPPRDQLGARVTVVRAQGPPLARRVASDGSYLSASDPRVLVGLGDNDRVRRIRVQWPDGAVEDFEATPLRSYTTLTRGQGLAQTAVR